MHLKRALIVGIVLIIVNCLWITHLEVVRYTHLTLIVPFPNVVFTLLTLVAFRALINRMSVKRVINQQDLTLIYVMLSSASAIASIDTIQILIPSMGHAFWFNTPENEWEELFWGILPKWLLVSDRGVLRGYYEGGTSLYRLEHIRAWLAPLVRWFAFTIVLVFMMVCLSIILRKQWTERERLTYPVIQLALEATDDSGKLFRVRLLWIGFAISAFISLINGLNYFFPSIPQIPVKRRSIGYLFSERPWNAMGNVQLSFYPFVIGISFLVPLDLLFSMWTFYWLYKLQLVLGSIAGLSSVPNFPYYSEQAFGAFLGIICVVFWLARGHFKRLVIALFKVGTSLDDVSEALPYRYAILGFILGFTFLFIFSLRAGMSAWAILVFFCLYFLLAIFVSRVRSELGFLVHNLSYLKPSDVMVKLFGTKRLGQGSLIMLSLYNFFIRTSRPHPMPHQLEAFKLAERTKVNNRSILIAIILASAVSFLTMSWSLLHQYYKFGADSGHFEIWTLGLGREVYNQIQNWLTFPISVEPILLGFMGVGMLISLFLAFMRSRFLWWHLHPLGYVMANDWGMYNLWSCILVSFVVKSLILKHGGLKAYRRSVPFFLGLAIGDCVLGSIWSIIGIALDKTIYQFFP